MLSGHQETIYVERALAAGARGYVMKGDTGELADAIHDVLVGKEYLSDATRGRLRERDANRQTHARINGKAD